MAFTERLKVIIDVVSDGATRGLAGFRSEVAKADTFTGKLKAGTKSLGSTFSSFISSPAGAATAVAAVTTAAVKAADKFAALSKTAIDLGKATGLSTEQASRWIAVGDDFGITADQLASGVGKIARNLDSGKWEKYGISTRDASGNVRDANDILIDALDVLSKTPSTTERARIGAELLGKGWASLAPIVGKSRDEYEKMLATVSDGQVITDAEAAKGEKWRLAMDKLNDAFGDVALGAGDLAASLAPVIDVLASIVEAAPEFLDFIGVANTGDENLARFTKRLQEVKGATWATTTAFGELSTGLLENADMVTQLSAMWDMRSMSDGEKNAYLMKAALEELGKTAPDAAAQVVASLEATLLAAYRGDEAARIYAEGWGLTIPVLSELKRLVPGVTSATDESTAATEANVEQIKAQREAFDRSNQAMRDRLDLQRQMYGDQRDLIDRGRDYLKTQEDLNRVMVDGKSTVTDQMDAIIKLSEEFGTLKGASLDSEDGTKRQILKLEELRAGVAPGSPLAIALKAYIDQLKLIPATVDTQVRLGIIGSVFNQVGDMIGQRFGARALGGPVEADRMYQVAEGGKPELLTDGSGRTFLIPGRDGVVTPITGTTGGSIGGGAPVTFNITVTNPVMSGEQLANQLRAYILRNGSAWLSR